MLNSFNIDKDSDTKNEPVIPTEIYTIIHAFYPQDRPFYDHVFDIKVIQDFEEWLLCKNPLNSIKEKILQIYNDTKKQFEVVQLRINRNHSLEYSLWSSVQPGLTMPNKLYHYHVKVVNIPKLLVNQVQIEFMESPNKYDALISKSMDDTIDDEIWKELAINIINKYKEPTISIHCDVDTKDNHKHDDNQRCWDNDKIPQFKIFTFNDKDSRKCKSENTYCFVFILSF